MEHWIGYATGKGIEIEIPKMSHLLKTTWIYAKEEPPVLDGVVSRLLLSSQKSSIGQQVGELDEQIAIAKREFDDKMRTFDITRHELIGSLKQVDAFTNTVSLMARDQGQQVSVSGGL